MNILKKINFIVKSIPRLTIRLVFDVSCILFRVKEDKVTFASCRFNQMTGNLHFVYKELVKKKPDYEYVFLLRKHNPGFFNTILTFFGMLKASYHLATSRYFVIDDYYFPIYVVKPRKPTEVIQLWHAAGALKKFGHSIIGKKYGASHEYVKRVPIHSNYSKVIVSSKEVIPFFSEAFNIPKDNIYPLGIPRIDYFHMHDEHIELKKRFYMRYPTLKSKKIVLYAPTFREGKRNLSTFKYPFNVPQLKKEIGEEYAVLVHFHPYTTNEAKQKASGFLYVADETFCIEELLIMADVLITDYSSIIFDYSTLERPMAFFADDLEDYIQERDFYYDYEQVIPGPILSGTAELVSFLKEDNFDLQKIKEFRQTFFDDREPNVTSRIVNQLFQIDNDE